MNLIQVALWKKLQAEYPEARCHLIYSNAFELLVATLLSAQCTDQRVNQVTPKLFKAFPDPTSLQKAPISQLETLIRSIGFFHKKARALIQLSQRLCDTYAGQVPATLTELITLPGVGRKTANVVLGMFYHIPSLVVDRHVQRVTHRMGLSSLPHPEQIEHELSQWIPREDWIISSLVFIEHGRKICQARQAKCTLCPIASSCPKIMRSPIENPSLQ